MTYELGITELHSPCMHGFTENSSDNIEKYHILIQNIPVEEFYSDSYLEWISVINYELSVCPVREHPIIQNYAYITLQKDYIKIDIVENSVLIGGEMVSCIKTFWLKIIQRMYKRVYRERKEILRLRSLPRTIQYRERQGKWPKYCCYYPQYKL